MTTHDLIKKKKRKKDGFRCAALHSFYFQISTESDMQFPTVCLDANNMFVIPLRLMSVFRTSFNALSFLINCQF